MTAPEICDMAGRGVRPPDDLDAAGWLLWYRMCEIYADHERGAIDAAEGARRKRDAITAHNRDHAYIEGGRDAMYRTAKLYADVERACTAFRKNPTIEGGFDIITAIHGC